jgi:tetratricopeptide (TPR) repeat protein
MTQPIPTPRAARDARAPVARTAAVAMAVCLALAGAGCGGDIEARMAEVRALQDVGQYGASIEELREILTISPDLPEATYRLGVALVQTGEPSRAVWALEKAAETQEYAIPAALLLASAHFGQSNFEACVRAADRVLEIDPNHDAALRLRAQGNLGSGRLDEALVDTERLLETHPDDYLVYAIYATLLGDLGRLEEAEAAHERLKEIALSGTDPAAAPRACLAPAMFARDQLKNPTRAEALYADCAERFPTNAFVISETMRFYDQIGESNKATDLVRSAVEQAPDNLSLRAHLATRLRTRGDPAAAEATLRKAAEESQSVGAWNLLANFYRLEKRPKEALEAIDKVAELSGGGSDPVRFAQADVLIDLGDYERAEAIAAALTEPTYATLLRGRMALERGDPQRALELFEAGIRTWPENAGARYLAGRAARELGDSERAVSELRESVRVGQSETPAAELLARLHYERGEYQDALRVGRIAARRRDANLVEVYLVGVRSFAALGQYEDARRTLDTLAELPGQRALAVAELAAVERAASGPEAAIAAIEASQLDLSDPENTEVLRAYADNLIAAERSERALAKIEAARKAHPDDADFQEMSGIVLTRLGRDDEARSRLEKAVELDPGHAAGWAGLATLEARGNQLPKAIELFDKAAALAPSVSVHPYSAAQLAFASGDRDGAERRLRQIVRRFPSHAGARNDLAWILAQKGEDLDLALALAEEAQRLDPSPEVLDTLGWVRFKRGEISAALIALEEAVAARQDSPSIRYRLGVVLSKAGNPKRAREMLQAAIEAGSFPEAADARRELAQLE